MYQDSISGVLASASMIRGTMPEPPPSPGLIVETIQRVQGATERVWEINARLSQIADAAWGNAPSVGQASAKTGAKEDSRAATLAGALESLHEAISTLNSTSQRFAAL